MKRLYSERDVARLAAGSCLELDADTLITPAARDLALTRGIRIVERGEKPASAAGAAASKDASAPATLPDGDYLLEVRDGKWSVRRDQEKK